MSISSGDKVFYYMTRDGLCFLTLAEARYPKRLAFLYLDEVGDVVLQELINEFGNNVRAKQKHLWKKSNDQQSLSIFSLSYLEALYFASFTLFYESSSL